MAPPRGQDACAPEVRFGGACSGQCRRHPDFLERRIWGFQGRGLEAKTYLHRGLRVVFLDETEKPARRDELTHEGGLSDWLTHVVQERGYATTGGTFNLAREGEPRLELALVWTEATDEHVRSYVNGISTPSGGTHENGLRSGITKAVRNYLETHELLPKGVTVTAEDIREGLVVLLSAYVLEPQFQRSEERRVG